MGLRTAVLLCALLPGAAASGLVPSAARACTCMRPGPPLVSAEAAAVVFEGRASAPVVEGTRRHRYTFEVLRTFKGETSTTVDVITPSSSAACGRAYEAGQTYLIYAFEESGGLGDALCTRSRLSSDAAEDFAALGEGVSISGDDSVDEPAGSPAEPPRIDKPATEPPPTTPSARGCAVGVAGLPHAPAPGGAALLVLLGVATVRRRAYRACDTRSRRHPCRSVCSRLPPPSMNL